MRHGQSRLSTSRATAADTPLHYIPAGVANKNHSSANLIVLSDEFQGEMDYSEYHLAEFDSLKVCGIIIYVVRCVSIDIIV